ncbi:hypothetical protein KFE26_13775 [Shewanella sp. M16]|uniref:hypothetical protein n=1 Tax=Shewanella sp. M16 TaxID=2830837 RepID=UPI001BAE848C|nr:hypothetical protein [Shewanella sp. M16]MBS0043360.1 hypothetical protein [Shewanella sp. M16]QYW06220.1 two helix-containing protein [Shewanella phage vB_SspS_MuM16-1]
MTTNPPKQPQTEQAQTPRAETSFKWLIILLAIVAGCLLAFYFSNFHGGIGDKGDFGAFGDYFGGVLNPILGFATVGLLVWSLKYQLDELALSRQELALTRQELAETKEETALSRKAMEEQVAHIQKEAKLNELMRLMSDLRSQYQILLSQELKSYTSDLSTQIYYHYSGKEIITIDSVIYGNKPYSASVAESIRIALKNAYDFFAQQNMVCQFKTLEEILNLYTTVVCRYSLSSSHSDISTIYLNEARQMLQPFQDVFWSEAISEQLKKINSFYELAKKSNTTA